MEALRDGVTAAGDDEAALAPALAAFADLLEAHVRCEERELFEVVPDVLAHGDAERLEAAIRAALGARPAA
jgi:hemerythrin-like domain-containing protein